MLYLTSGLQSVQRHGSMPLTFACSAAWTCAKGSRVARSASAALDHCYHGQPARHQFK